MIPTKVQISSLNPCYNFHSNILATLYHIQKNMPALSICHSISKTSTPSTPRYQLLSNLTTFSDAEELFNRFVD